MKKIQFLFFVLICATTTGYAQEGTPDTEPIPPLVFGVPENGILVINNSDCDDVKIQIGLRGINNSMGLPLNTNSLSSGGGQQIFSFNEVMSLAWPTSNPYGTGYVGFAFNYIGINVTGGSIYMKQYVTALGPNVNYFLTGEAEPCDCLKVTTQVVWQDQSTYTVAYLLVLIENC